MFRGFAMSYCGRVHVATGTEELRADVLRRAGNAQLGPEATEELLSAVLAQHARNRQRYAEVVYRGAN